MKFWTLSVAASLVLCLPVTSHAFNILISGAAAGNNEIEAFLLDNFFLPAGTTFTKGNFANFNNNVATIQAADLVIIGRSLSSGNYQNGVADGYTGKGSARGASRFWVWRTQWLGKC